MDIREHSESVEAINAILNNGGIAEVKLEGKDRHPVIVEIKRTVKSKNIVLGAKKANA